MGRVSTWRCLLLAAAVAVLVSASARADVNAAANLVIPDDVLVASVAQVGVVNLSYDAAVGTRVTFSERVGRRLETLGITTVQKPPVAVLLGATRWRCDRVVRRFEATAIGPDGARTHATYDVRTPSCANRFRLSVPRRVALGATARIRITDKWKTGATKPRLCITPPDAPRACRVLAFARAVDIAGRPLHATKRGAWRVELRGRGHRERATVAVGGARSVSPAPLTRLVATGDSMIQGIDSFLGDRLAGTATVRSDVEAGTGVSRDLDWLTRATAQTKKVRQRTTVILMGDAGYPMRTADGTTHECCDALWAAEYARRARVMMKTYIRHGRGHVLWLTMPTPRSLQLAVVTAFQNAAILRAAEGLKGARILRLDSIFTPTGFREYMRHRGQVVRVRQSDGFHLTATGASIAAAAVEKSLRGMPGWLGRHR